MTRDLPPHPGGQFALAPEDCDHQYGEYVGIDFRGPLDRMIRVPRCVGCGTDISKIDLVEAAINHCEPDEHITGDLLDQTDGKLYSTCLRCGRKFSGALDFWVTTEVGIRTISFRRKIDSPIARHSIHISKWDLLIHLLFGHGPLNVFVTTGEN